MYKKVLFILVLLFISTISFAETASINVASNDFVQEIFSGMHFSGSMKLNVFDNDLNTWYFVNIENDIVTVNADEKTANPNYIIKLKTIAKENIANSKDIQKEIINQYKLGNIEVYSNGVAEYFQLLAFNFYITFLL